MIETTIIKSPITIQEFQKLLLKEKDNFGILKAAIDIEKEYIAIDCTLHFDCAKRLYDTGSNYHNVWGIEKP